jgi:hypothetical protein
MVSPNDRLRLPPPWISSAAGMPDREVRPVIIVQRRRLFYPSYVQDYLDRVTAADVAAGNTSGLELGVTDGANTFIQDLVSDTYLGVSGGVISQAASVIKASVPMAGARTRLGAMTPLVGAGPTSFNFGDNDYNRKTGLVGDATTKYLESNYAFPTNLQNNCHLSNYDTAVGTTGLSIGYGDASSNGSYVSKGAARLYQASDSFYVFPDATTPGFRGVSRDNSANFDTRYPPGTNGSSTKVSLVVTHDTFAVFARKRNGPSISNYCDARIAFYSTGESLDLAILDARVTALINAYAAAIP